MSPGRDSVLAALWRLGVAETIAYRGSTVVWILTTTFPLVSLTLWYALAEQGPIGDYDQAAFVGYFVGAFLVRQATASWVVWDLDRQIRLGDLTPLLMRPVHPLLHHAVVNVAALPIRLLLALPISLVVLVGAGGLQGAGGNVAWFLPVALVGGWAIGFCGQVLVGSLAFWLTHASSLYEIWIGLFIIFSGYAVPTSLFPAQLAVVARLSPFHASLGFPVELLLGRLDGAEVLAGFGLQLGWVVVLGGLAWVTWKRGLRVYGAEGM